MLRNLSGIGCALAIAATLSGCRVNVDKAANGDEKRVQVDTPFGGIHINSNQVTATDLGLPIYPGAKAVTDDQNSKSADIHMGFGEWQLRVRTVAYDTPDESSKVADFYKKALSRYGDVLTCQDRNPVGTPTSTSEGLTCADDGDNKNVHVNVDGKGWDASHSTTNSGIEIGHGLELKAGSKRHQHIVGFDEKNKAGKTRFVLVALDLPVSGKKESD